MRESHIEKRVCEIAKKHGWLVFKWQSTNVRGVPDRIFVRQGEIVFIEFKAPGKKPTKLQAHIHRKLREEGSKVHVIDSIEAGADLLAR